MVLEEVREVQRTEVWESSSSKGVQQSETTEKLKVHRKKGMREILSIMTLVKEEI